MRVRRHSPRYSNAGFTLLEVMIAVIVLSFGVLGVVGLQAASLQANKEARRQSAAVRMARELADMMRGNNTISAVNTTQLLNPYLINWNASTSSLPTAASTDCSVNPSPCTTTTQVAQFEASDWLSRVNLELPEVRVVVCFDAQPYSGGTAQWTCTGTGNVAVVKIGWVRQSTNRAASGTAAFDRATTPAIVLPVAL